MSAQDYNFMEFVGLTATDISKLIGLAPQTVGQGLRRKGIYLNESRITKIREALMANHDGVRVDLLEQFLSQANLSATQKYLMENSITYCLFPLKSDLKSIAQTLVNQIAQKELSIDVTVITTHFNELTSLIQNASINTLAYADIEQGIGKSIKVLSANYALTPPLIVNAKNNLFTLNVDGMFVELSEQATKQVLEDVSVYESRPPLTSRCWHTSTIPYIYALKKTKQFIEENSEVEEINTVQLHRLINFFTHKETIDGNVDWALMNRLFNIKVNVNKKDSIQQELVKVMECIDENNDEKDTIIPWFKAYLLTVK